MKGTACGAALAMAGLAGRVKTAVRMTAAALAVLAVSMIFIPAIMIPMAVPANAGPAITLLETRMDAVLSAPDEDGGRFDLSLHFGRGSSRADGKSSYRHEWSSAFYPRIVDENQITIASDGAIYASGFFSYYFNANLGFQAGFGYLKSFISANSIFDLDFIKSSLGGRQDQWTGAGEITAIPLCLNVVGRAEGESLQAYASAGISIFLNAFQAEIPVGIAAVVDEKIDAFKIPAAIADTTWLSLGTNIGAGVDFKIGKSVALNLEARYFSSPPKIFPWAWTPGVYDGLEGNMKAWNFSREAAFAAEGKTDPLTIDPSFFQISVGLKFLFPGPTR